MKEYQLFNEENKPSSQERKEIIEFLYQHLEQFGDSKEDIEKCVQYAIKESDSFGGFILQSFEG